MGKFFKKYFWTMLIVIAALGLAGSAAYFSISGLSKLFAGSAFQVIIMAAFIEFAKIGTTAALHRYWKSMKGISLSVLKWILALMVVVVMAITSSGIYGFLADAYSITSIELAKIDGQISLVEKQQEQKRVQITGIEEIKNSKSNRVRTLVSLRVQQEIRLDSLYNKGWSSSARKTQKLINQSTEEIKSLQIEVDSLLVKINGVNEEIGLMDIEILDLQNSDVATEIGPLKYMSTVLDTPMENIINWFILLIIFVFDPLAVLLIVFANVVYDKSIEAYSNKVPPKKKEEINFIVEPREEVKELIEKEKVDKEKSQKVINAINNEGLEVLDFSHDFPGEEEKEVVKYVENKDGGFEKSNDNITSLIKNIDSNPVYIKLIDVLFLDGKRVAEDVIPPYKDFVKDIKTRNIECEDKVIKNFLTICNLLSITDMTNKDNVKITMDYESSKKVVSLVSK